MVELTAAEKLASQALYSSIYTFIVAKLGTPILCISQYRCHNVTHQVTAGSVWSHLALFWCWQRLLVDSKRDLVAYRRCEPSSWYPDFLGSTLL